MGFQHTENWHFSKYDISMRYLKGCTDLYFYQQYMKLLDKILLLALCGIALESLPFQYIFIYLFIVHVSLITTANSVYVCLAICGLFVRYLLPIFLWGSQCVLKNMFLQLQNTFSLCSWFNFAKAKEKLSGADLFDSLLNCKLNEGRGNMFHFILVILGTQSVEFNKNIVFVQ